MKIPDDDVIAIGGDSDERSDPSDPKAQFISDVVAVLPDICTDFLSEFYDEEGGGTTESLIAKIFDVIDRDTEYPKAKVKIRPLKRKREETSNSQANSRVECVNDVAAVFPDICRNFVSELLDSGVGATAEPLIAHILDDMERGVKYPKARDKARRLKIDEDEEATKEYGRADRESVGDEYQQITFVTETFT